jgi:Tfp pilus assembly protein FimT
MPARRSHAPPGALTRLSGAAGVTLIELLLVVSMTATIAGLALPAAGEALDEIRTAQAARYLSQRLARARLEAILQSRAVALRFLGASGDYNFAGVADGNGNGVRSADIAAGTDPVVTSPERLGDKFSGVRFGLDDGVPDVDGAAGTGGDGVRVGSARIATMTPDGTATSGTLYVRGRRAQYAVRILGATGRVRVFHYRRGGGGWIAD